MKTKLALLMAFLVTHFLQLSGALFVFLAMSASICTTRGQSILQFSTNSYTVAENAGTATLTVQRTGDTNTEVGTAYATADGTATNGLKYMAVSGTRSFGPGETIQTIVVPILNDGLVQGSKYFRVLLSNPTAGATLGSRTNITVSITDNDYGIQFQFATNSVMEDAGTVVFRVVRGEDGVLPVAVDFATSDLTATNGLDYTGTTNTISFAPGERLKLVSIPILNNSLKQPNRAFRVTLTNPVNATLGRQATAMVMIEDNDQGFQFESANYTVAEDTGVARLSVLRGTDDTNSTLAVDCATEDATATDGLDYAGITNTLTFAAGEIRKLISVPILNDGLNERAKTFRVTLRKRADGGALKSPATTTVSILDNDPGLGFERPSYTSTWDNMNGMTVVVLRGNDQVLGPMTVDYATRDSTAKAGEDYQAVSGTLEFKQNETVKTMTIPLFRNRAVGAAKSFNVILSNPTGGATLGISSTTVSIVGAYFTLAPPFDTALTIRREGGINLVIWVGGGQLQKADNPAGPWQTLTTATSPLTVQSPITSTFYRVSRPRLINVYVPSSYDRQKPLPLVILLHGYTGSGVEEESYTGLRPFAESRGFLYCYPDGTTDRWHNRFWNATDGCCDFGSTGVDDVRYLRGLIEEIGTQFAMDRKRVYLVGHSNGGFMAYRMACESADLIAGIASFAGVTFFEPSRCVPSEPVNILQIHGTADQFIFYEGGGLISEGLPQTFPGNLPTYPGALQTVQMWAAYNGATGAVSEPAPSLDLTTDLPGLDTVITRYTNAPAGGAIELWTIPRGIHYPTLSSQFSPKVIDWFLAHPKP